MRPRFTRSLAFMVVASLAGFARAGAQARPPMHMEHLIALPSSSILYRSDPIGPVDTTSKRHNPALRGAVIGGATVGLAAAVYAYHGPFEDKQCIGCAVGGFVVGAVVGSVIGGFIGSAIGN